jgi:hypothetical protein
MMGVEIMVVAMDRVVRMMRQMTCMTLILKNNQAKIPYLVNLL